MSIVLGDIDVAKEIVELHFQLRRTQRLLDIALGKIGTATAFTQAELNTVEEDSIRFVQSKFPNMGIKKQ